MTSHNERLATEAPTPSAASERRGISGIGRVLVVVYGILALGATGRSFVQVAERFDEAPIAYSLSALAAVVYIVATIALIKSGSGWYRIAWATISFELLGVLTIGTLSIVESQWFPEATVWSYFGAGYLFIPLVLPPLGMWWLSRHRPTSTRTGSAA
jgi:hypothetical protein